MTCFILTCKKTGILPFKILRCSKSILNFNPTSNALLITPFASMSLFSHNFTCNKINKHTQKRTIFNRPMPKQALGPVLFGTGFLGIVLGISWWISTKENKFADDKQLPIYPKKPTDKINGDLPVTASFDSASSKLPTYVQHIIIGAGAAGLSAARAIRASDPLSKVLIISGDETCGEPSLTETNGQTPPPYIRPLLSKGLWWRKPARRKQMLNPDGDVRKHSWLFFEPQSFFIDPKLLSEVEYGGISLLRNNSVITLNPDSHQVILSTGHSINYDCCLIATGAKPKRIPELEICSQTKTDLVKHGRVSYFRSLRDYSYLQELSDKLHSTGGTIAVIGGGVLGSELSVSIASKSLSSSTDGLEEESSNFSVHHIVRGKSLMEHILPPIISESIGQFEESKGVILSTQSNVSRISLVNPKDSIASSKLRLSISHKKTDDCTIEEELIVDHVVCAVGVDPRTDLAKDANLELDPINRGFLVNSEMESRANVYAAGDAASYWDPGLECRRRVEHLNSAEENGAIAGINMANAALSIIELKDQLPADKIYDPTCRNKRYQPSFWCSLGTGAAFEAVGVIDSKRFLTRTYFSKPIVEQDSFGKSRAVVFYLTPDDKKRLMGILLWNLTEDFYVDKEFAAPSRLHLARHFLDKNVDLTKNENELLTDMTSQFDVNEEIAKSYADLRAFTKSKNLELLETGENKDLSTSIPTESNETISEVEPQTS